MMQKVVNIIRVSNMMKNPIMVQYFSMVNKSFYMVPNRTFVKSLEERKEDQERKAFQDDIKYFLSKDTFNLHDFHERVLHGLKQKSTFKLMIWGEDAEVKVLENQNKICSALYDDEKNNITLITPTIKQEVAETTQLQISDVQDVISKYKQLRDFHNWLKGKQTRNEPMPDSREELMQMYRIERPSFLMPKQHKKSYSKAQIKYSFRRHHT